MKRIEIRLEQSDIELLDIQAKEQGMHRAELIRKRLFDGAPKRSYSPKDLAALVSRAHRSSNMPRGEVERVVYSVFTALMSGC